MNGKKEKGVFHSSIFSKSTRGQGLSTNAIILIILGVIVLAVLAVGFALGWGTLKDKIAPSNNVNSIVTGCQTACSTQSTYDFCSLQRTLKADGLPAGSDGKIPKEVQGTCFKFSTDSSYDMYGVAECPELASECPPLE